MSLAFRLAAIEASIPFEDVLPLWRDRREPWAIEVAAQARSATALSVLAVELLESLTDESIAQLFPSRAAYTRFCRRFKNVAEAVPNPMPPGEQLKRGIKAFEELALPPPRESEKPLLDKGRAEELELEDPGPECQVGERCVALDIRLCW
jgi:hypothetical protein